MLLPCPVIIRAASVIAPSHSLTPTHMLPQLPNRKFKVASTLGGIAFLGLAISAFALTYQQSKVKGA